MVYFIHTKKSIQLSLFVFFIPVLNAEGKTNGTLLNRFLQSSPTRKVQWSNSRTVQWDTTYQGSNPSVMYVCSVVMRVSRALKARASQPLSLCVRVCGVV
jgi:hypothetical protein